LAKLTAVAGVMRVTIVGSQGEADVICSLLRAHGIDCSDRGADLSAERGGGFFGWREILVGEADLQAARELLERAPKR
jgi:Putative prokaryotic signal transducing protein